MDKPLKRILSIALALIMVIPVVPTAVYAESSWNFGTTTQLDIKDGTITKDELYQRFLTLFGKEPISGGSFMYDTSSHSDKMTDLWYYHGTAVQSGDMEKVELADKTTYYAARETKATRYADQKSFTVRYYHAVTASVASGAPAGAGVAVSAQKVYARDEVTITAKAVDGYKTVLVCGETTVESGTYTYVPTASDSWTVSYVSTGAAQQEKYNVTLEVVGNAYGTASLSHSGEQNVGTDVAFTAVPGENGYIVSIDVSGAEAAVGAFDADRARTGSFTVGKSDVTVTVTFAEHRFPAKETIGPVNWNPGEADMQKIRQAVFDAVVDAEKAGDMTAEDMSIAFYVDEAEDYRELDAESVADFGSATEKLRITWTDESGKYPEVSWEGEVELRDDRPEYTIGWKGGKSYSFKQPSEVESYVKANLEVSTAADDVGVTLTGGALPEAYDTPAGVTYTVTYEGSVDYQPASRTVELEVTRLPEKCAIDITLAEQNGTVTFSQGDWADGFVSGASDVALTVIPDAGYAVSELYVADENGARVSGDITYESGAATVSFKSGSGADYTLKAEFEPVEITVRDCGISYRYDDLLAELLGATAITPDGLNGVEGSWYIDYQPFGDVSGMALITSEWRTRLQWQDVNATEPELDALLNAMGRKGEALRSLKHTFGKGPVDQNGKCTETVRIRFQSADGKYAVTSNQFTVTVDCNRPAAQIRLKENASAEVTYGSVTEREILAQVLDGVYVDGVKAENASVTFETDPTGLNAGTHTLRLICPETEEHQAAAAEVEVLVQKAESGFSLADSTVAYDGESHMVGIENPENACCITVIETESGVNITFPAEFDDLVKRLPAVIDADELKTVLGNLDLNDEVLEKLSQAVESLSGDSIAVNGSGPVQAGTYRACAVAYSENYKTVLSEAVLTITVPEKVPSGEITDTGRTLSLEGSIYINQYVQITGFEGVDIASSGGLLIWDHEISEEEALFGAKGAVVKEGLIRVGGEYAQRTDGIAARRYADKLYLRVYLEVADGVYAYGPLKEYSVQKYCENKLSDPGSSAELKAVCAAMLHYGAAAQVYFGDYKPYGYADANILDQYPTAAWEPGLLTSAAEVPASGISATGDVADKGKSLSLTGAVCVNYYYGAEFTGGIVTAELLVWDGVRGPLTEENVSYRKPLNLTGSEYAAQTDGIPARKYGDTIYTCAHFVDAQGNDHYSRISAYSPEVYAARKLSDSSTPEALREVCRRMVMFGECAENYFASMNQD